MSKFKTVPEIIEACGVSALARALGHANASTVSSWKTRESIPPRQWGRVIKATKAIGVLGVDYMILVRACAHKLDAAE
jgi:hypothetical protein